MQAGGFARLLRDFAQALADDARVRVAAWSEDQLKAPVKSLIEDAARQLGRTAACRMEVHAEGVAGRPDMGVAVGGLLAGYVELKAPGKGARPDRFGGADLAQ